MKTLHKSDGIVKDFTSSSTTTCCYSTPRRSSKCADCGVYTHHIPLAWPVSILIGFQEKGHNSACQRDTIVGYGIYFTFTSSFPKLGKPRVFCKSCHPGNFLSRTSGSATAWPANCVVMRYFKRYKIGSLWTLHLKRHWTRFNTLDHLAAKVLKVPTRVN